MAAVLSTEDKQELITRYDDIEFVDDVTDFLCHRCRRVAIVHYFADCDHVFCLNCQQILTPTDEFNALCPTCKKPIGYMLKQKIDFERKLNEISISCLNKTYGCTFVAVINQMPRHLKQCKNTKEAALPRLWTPDSENNNKLSLRVKLLEEKLNKLSFDFESKLTETLDITLKQRLNEWQNKMNTLETSFTEMKHNLEKERVLEKPEQAITRLDLVQLENKNKHDLLTNVVLIENKIKALDENINFRLDEIQKQLIRFQVDEQWTKQMRSLETQIDKKWEQRFEALEKTFDEFKMSGGGKKLPEDGSVCEEFIIDDFSKINAEIQHDFSFHALNCKVQAFIKVPAIGPIVLSLLLSDAQSKNLTKLPFGCFPSVTYTVTNSGFTLTRHSDIIFQNRQSSFNQRAYYAWLPSKDVIKKKLTDGDRLNMNIFLSSPFEKPASTDGVIEWRITDYSKKKRLEVDDLCPYQQSPVFYTHRAGYRVRARVWLNGVDTQKNIGVSAIAVFLAGENDEKLQKTFNHTRTFAILDQNDSRASGHVRTSTGSDLTVPRVHLGTHEELENGRFIKNDVIVIRISIKIL